MLPTMPIQGSKSERKLIKLFKALNVSKQETLISFAEFLLAQIKEDKEDKDPNLEQGDKKETITEPLDIERPENESVIKGIKRLSETYPMVDKDNILHPISDLMTAHMLQGKEAKQIIDELEAVFLKEYLGKNT